ncbi:hypothetical protein ABBQ38_015427 [Trebouxia sp. C0009 RCD-2024]
MTSGTGRSAKRQPDDSPTLRLKKLVHGRVAARGVQGSSSSRETLKDDSVRLQTSCRRRSSRCSTACEAPSSMGSRAARSLLGPLVDGYRDLTPSKQGLDRTSTAGGNNTMKKTDWENMDLGGGGGGAKAAEIFKRYDGDNTGNIDDKEMMQALAELGVLDPKDKQAAKALRSEMKAADTNQDGMISFIEFLGYFQKMARYQADLARTQRLESYGRPRELPPSYEANPTLQQCFRNFCVYGKNHGISQGGPTRSIHLQRMNNFQFIHLCKDAGFAEPEGRLHREALDVIFFRAAAIGQRHISFRGPAQGVLGGRSDSTWHHRGAGHPLGGRGRLLLNTSQRSLPADVCMTAAMEFLQALAIIADECGMELVDAAVQLGADPAHLQGMYLTQRPAAPVSDSEREEWKASSKTYNVPSKVANAWKREKKIKAKKRVAPGQGIPLSPALHASEGMMQALNGTSPWPQAETVSRKQLAKMLAQARQQSVEEVNQRWAAKSHTLLSRIANLEQQLQGQGQGQSGTSPTSDFQMPGSGQEGVSNIIVQGGEQYGLNEASAEMDLLRHEIDVSIDQKLKGVEKRLQVSTALAALKPQLLAALDVRFQGFDTRLQALESQSRTQLRALEAGVAALQRQIPASAGGAGVSPEAFDKLASMTHAMQRSMEQMQSSGGKSGLSKAEIQAAVLESERRLAEKHARLEGAVVQVAGRVDMLDGRVKQEQESSLRALEAILSESGHGKR